MIRDTIRAMRRPMSAKHRVREVRYTCCAVMDGDISPGAGHVILTDLLGIPAERADMMLAITVIRGIGFEGGD